VWLFEYIAVLLD